MTPAQEQHIITLIRRFEAAADKKYRTGQAEHGGNLWDLPILQILDNAIDEVVDQFIYLSTLKDKLLAIDIERLTNE